MSIRTTDDLEPGAGILSVTAVALYDDTTDLAFGPVFASAEHARDYLGWIITHVHGADPRRLAPAEHAALRDAWQAQRCDPDSGELRP